MSDSPAIRALQELIERGLIAAQPAPLPLETGNHDRRAGAARTAWRATLPDGRTVRLQFGTGLADLAQRQAAFAAACPDMIPAPVFHQLLAAGGESFADLFFAGMPLESMAGTAPDLARSGFVRILTGLAATTRLSTETARTAEWLAWTGQVEALGFWTATEHKLLREVVWPRLAPLLCTAPPVTRWTNGDFTSKNILLAQSGDVRLIDCEFAAETHFPREDDVRFATFSPAARQWPDLFSPPLPSAGPAWHLFFWLRQLVLETGQNTDAYLSRVRLDRLGLIRRLGETVLGCELVGWSVPAAPLHYNLEVGTWAQTADSTLRLSGWCHVPAATIRAVILMHGDHLLAQAVPQPRPDVQAHFSGASEAVRTGFVLNASLPEPDVPLVLSALTADGVLLPFHAFRSGDLPKRSAWVEDYARWAARYDPDPAPPAAILPGPLFSILLPVYRTPPGYLEDCIQSVLQQHYASWELVIVDDGSGSPELSAQLQRFAAAEPRLHLLPRSTNGGIATATNDALAAAQGDFILLLDHDDILRPHALTEFSTWLHDNPEWDALYSDEDKITADGRCSHAFLKPDFSPEFLLGVMYVGHALCVRTTVARAAGGFDPRFDGVQDYEFFLRVTERTRRIGHVPRLLYHWRQSPASSALHGNVKGDMDEKQAAAVRAHLSRLGRSALVAQCGGHRVSIQPDDGPEPTVEIVSVSAHDNPLAALRRAALAGSANILVLLDSELSALSQETLCKLATLAARPDSGVVAPVLLSCEGPVLESGWTAGPRGAAPLMRGFDASGDGYNGSLVCTREVAAVSPHCAAVRRNLLAATRANDWLGFCLCLRTDGLFNRVCAGARVQTGFSWRRQPTLFGAGPIPLADPFFNPHFDIRLADYRLRRDLPAPPPFWYLDTPPPARVGDGCFYWRGWCFQPGAGAVTVRVVIPGVFTWNAISHLPRPDVLQRYPAFGTAECGFELRLRLPAGKYEFRFESIAADGTVHPLFCHMACVTSWRRAGLMLHGSPEKLLPFQLIAAPSILPRPIPLPAISPVSVATVSRPAFAIVTPSFQQGNFLEQCLRSVLDQSGIELQYVVQDGGSTDDTLAVLRRHGARLRAWTSAPDCGQADAIAQGFAQTSGGPDDVMAWLNSDDFYLPGTLARVGDYFARHPTVDVVYGHRVVVDEEGRQVGRWFMPPHDDDVLRLNDFIPQETMFWRRRLWDQVGGVDPAYQFALDWDLLLRFQSVGARMVRLPHFLACFRVHSAQKTSRALHTLGHAEIETLRARANGRTVTPAEIIADSRLLSYLRHSARLEWWHDLAAPPHS